MFAQLRRLARRCLVVATASTFAAGGLVMSSAAAPSSTLPAASADPCLPVEVIFARGREEPPGIGRVGDAFVGALNARLPSPVGVYAVNYPADTEIPQGANDINRRIQYMAGACPATRLVVGGYSLGAASAALALSATRKGAGFTNPLPAGLDSHVAAVVLVGNITRRMHGSEIGPAYRDKTIDICNSGDPVCSDGIPQSWEELQRVWPTHHQPGYINSGLIEQAADFVAARVQ